MAFAAEDPRHLGVVALVAQHVVADGARRARGPAASPMSSLVAPNQVSGVALFDQLGDRARGGERDVVGVGLDRQQYLAAVRLAGGGALQNARPAARRRGLLGARPPAIARRRSVGAEIAP